MNMKSDGRPYIQTRRASAAAATGSRITSAAAELFFETGGTLPVLEAVAKRADVTVQTIIRRYGGKDGLFAAAVAASRQTVVAARGKVTPGDVPGAIDNLLEHYAEWGDRSLLMLSLEGRNSAAAMAVKTGRAVHRKWVASVFAPLLGDLAAAVRRRRLAQLVTLTDVYAWKLLHRDQGLSRAETRLALLELISPLTATPQKHGAAR